MLAFSNVNVVLKPRSVYTYLQPSVAQPGIVCSSVPLCYFLRNSVEREVLGIISAGQREGGDDRGRSRPRTVMIYHDQRWTSPTHSPGRKDDITWTTPTRAECRTQ